MRAVKLVTEEARPAPRHEAGGAPRRLTSAELPGDDRRLLILHAGETCTLQVSRQNKLLLTE